MKSEAAVDLYVIVEYGTPIQRAAMDAQENVRKAIESMTGLHVVRVDVHVQGVSFEQENKALQSGAESAALVAGEAEPEKLAEPVTEETKETAKPEEEKKPARPRNKNTRSKKETPKAEEEAAPETEKAPEEDKPSEEA